MSADGGRRGGGRARIPPRAAVGLCLVAAAGALAWAGLRGNSSSQTASDPGSSPDLEAAREVVESRGKVVPSARSSFLEDASAASAASADGLATVGWDDGAALPDAAAGVLEAYAGEGACALAASGYLDLKGDAWGAVVRGAAGWVDIVSVSAREDGSSSVRVTRVRGDA